MPANYTFHHRRQWRAHLHRVDDARHRGQSDGHGHRHGQLVSRHQRRRHHHAGDSQPATHYHSAVEHGDSRRRLRRAAGGRGGRRVRQHRQRQHAHADGREHGDDGAAGNDHADALGRRGGFQRPVVRQGRNHGAGLHDRRRRLHGPIEQRRRQPRGGKSAGPHAAAVEHGHGGRRLRRAAGHRGGRPVRQRHHQRQHAHGDGGEHGDGGIARGPPP